MHNDLAHLRRWLGTGSINIFGRPFAGKDTQGRILADLFEGTLLGGGDILRGADMPDHIKTLMHTGELIPTQDYINIVLPRLRHEDHNDRPLILSSVGRWHGEEEGVIRATDEAGHPLRAVVYLDLDEDTVRERWKKLHLVQDRGERHDDTEEILEIRLKEFREKTLPVIETYRERGLLIPVEGHRSPEEVTTIILAALWQHAR